MIKAVIYDMDDLMVNSCPLHTKANEILLKEYGHDLSELPKDALTGFVGRRITDILQDIISLLKLDVQLSDLLKRRQAMFLDLVSKKLEPMPGLLESLTFLKRNNYKTAMATSGTKKYISIVMQKFNLSKYFDVIVSGDDVTAGKPDPEIYLMACSKLGLTPEECAVLEDATSGIVSAKGAGCKCIAIPSPYTPVQDHSKADIILESLNEINMELLKKL